MENKIIIELFPHRQFNTTVCSLQLSVETRSRPYHAQIEMNIPELHDKIEVLKGLASEIQSLLLMKRDQFQTVKWKS
jgi:hypothetical protein